MPIFLLGECYNLGRIDLYVCEVMHYLVNGVVQTNNNSSGMNPANTFPTSKTTLVFDLYYQSN